jgi:formate-dependent nitrite reductase membrane component NrfD
MVQLTPQREWIERRGILLWLAFFFIELGAGTFVISSIFNSLWGQLIGWLVCAVLGGGCHLVYLGRPFRFWRMVFSSGWRTSWISRGLIFVAGFLLLGLVHMALVLWASPSLPLLVVVDILAFATVIYGGFAMNYINALQLWNTALLPVLYVAAGFWGGSGLTLATLMVTGTSGVVAGVEEWARVFLLAYIVIVFSYLMSIRYQGLAGKVSIGEIVSGRWAALFWVMVITLGVVLPMTVVISSFLIGLGATPVALLYGAIAFELLGDLSLRFLILKCALYSPLIPSSSYSY